MTKQSIKVKSIANPKIAAQTLVLHTVGNIAIFMGKEYLITVKKGQGYIYI